jgi:dipeptidyl aminopeptidase/acylaminoacyl peptidase
MRLPAALIILFSLVLAACGGRGVEAVASLQDPPAGVRSGAADLPAPRLTTSTPAPSPTSSSTPTPSPTASPSPTPTLHPLSIDWLRQQEFPGSEIVIEETLENGPNYYRYIASYRSDGLKINALLTVPYGQAPETGWPVIIFNHGYIPPDQYQTTERYVAYVDGFARSGYIVLRSDYRGHADSEGVARGAYGSPDYVVDVLNAVAAMKAFPEADPARIGMWGHSMGGYITLRSMVASPDIKAGVIWAGVVGSYPDLLARWRRSSSGASATPRPGSWRSSLTQMYGPPESNPEFWDSISANSYLQDLSGPIQLHHGTADTSVPYEFSETLYNQIQSAGGVAEYYTYEGDDHNLATLFTQAMLRSIYFFDQYVKGAQEP